MNSTGSVARRFGLALARPAARPSRPLMAASLLATRGMASSKPLPPFHLAIPVHNLAAARDFYGRVMNCSEGRSSQYWIDWNLYGHQLVTHWASDDYRGAKIKNSVDAKMVPVPHFGACLTIEDFKVLADRLKAEGTKFIIEPHVRFPGAKGEQWTMFFEDPSGNSLEFKAMKDPDNLFAKYHVDEKM
eukprot:TRINITY_DN9506_c0_g1_i3.p1 TRINITY_DN9506_c0_g1~~TRINITY_DN9506_c0_g1_i3.p1  ORF type:complete len:188 (-),score=55.91 TRINITY_DN9506_c0_g1_i3:118-681(-)